MQLHDIRPIHKSKKKKRVGRGGKRGTFSGRGIKGQKSRAGARLEPVIRSLIKKYPKIRGYKFKSIKTKPAIVNVSTLEKNFKSGEKVNPNILLEKKLVSRIKGRLPQVKILGKGDLSKSLIIESCELSKSAKEKIEKAGGIIKSKITNSN